MLHPPLAGERQSDLVHHGTAQRPLGKKGGLRGGGARGRIGGTEDDEEKKGKKAGKDSGVKREVEKWSRGSAGGEGKQKAGDEAAGEEERSKKRYLER